MQECPGSAEERLVPYDDFNATQIDPDKWFGIEPGTEAIRQIQGNRLRLVYRAYGRADSDNGLSRNQLGLAFHNSAAVTAITATVQVIDVVTTGCPGNPEATVAWAWLRGYFFNTAPSTPFRGAANDVLAAIWLVRRSDSTDPPDVLRVRCAVFHCTNADCTASSTLHFQDLGPVKLGERGRLRLQWDRDNHRFIFQRDDVPNCTATPRPVAFTEALFDDVEVAPHAGAP